MTVLAAVAIGLAPLLLLALAVWATRRSRPRRRRTYAAVPLAAAGDTAEERSKA